MNEQSNTDGRMKYGCVSEWVMEKVIKNFQHKTNCLQTNNYSLHLKVKINKGQRHHTRSAMETNNENSKLLSGDEILPYSLLIVYEMILHNLRLNFLLKKLDTSRLLYFK